MSNSLAIRQHIAVLVLVATTVVTVAGIGRLQLNSHFTVYFDRDDPLLLAHQRISALYGRQDSLFVVLQSPDSFLKAANYSLLEDITRLLGNLPFVSRAMSISELGIVGETLAENGDFIPSPEQLAAESRALGLLLAEDTLLAGVWVQIELQDKHSHAVLGAVGTVRETVDHAIDGLPISAHYTGTLALNEAYIEVVKHDLVRVVPLLLLAMMCILGWLLRSGLAVLTLLPIGASAVFVSFGTAGIFGADLAAIHAFVPIIVLTISLAGCVHMALSYNRYRADGVPAEEAALSAARYNLLPMALANGTTALGFLGLMLSPSPPIRALGYMVAAGIAVALVLCMTLLPLLQARFDPWKPVAASGAALLDRLVDNVARRRKGIIAVFALLSLPAVWLASKNVVSDNVLEYFVPSHPFQQDTRLVEDRLSGVNEVIYSVESGEPFGLFNAGARSRQWTDFRRGFANSRK